MVFVYLFVQRRSGEAAVQVSKPQFYSWEGATENIHMVDTKVAADMPSPIANICIMTIF